MLIYIMGRGHNGSTIVDIVLGSGCAVEGVGELVSGLELEDWGHPCACGTPMRDCSYWKQAREAFEAESGLAWGEAARETVEATHIQHFFGTLLAPRGSRRQLGLARASHGFEKAISAASGKPHVVDSSKEPTRALMLLRFQPDARAIHLVRDPRRTVASYYWRFRKGGGYFHFLRRKYRAPWMLVPFMTLTALTWTVGNGMCELARRFAPDRVLRMRYEDFSQRPAEEVERVERLLGVPLGDVASRIRSGEALEIGHNAGGNPIRRSGSVTLEPERGSAHDLPWWLEGITLALCWPLMLRYGYALQSGRHRS